MYKEERKNKILSITKELKKLSIPYCTNPDFDINIYKDENYKEIAFIVMIGLFNGEWYCEIDMHSENERNYYGEHYNIHKIMSFITEEYFKA